MKAGFIAGCSLPMLLTGCVTTTLRSMASQPMPTAHQPRVNPESKDAEVDVSVDGFGMIKHHWFNTSEINAGGGMLGFTYRFGGKLSPLFVNANVGAFGGTVQFDCDKKSRCDSTYLKWIDTDEGKDDYSFWSVSEQVVAGAEFQLPAQFFLGFGAGVKLIQGGGDYDDKREELEDRNPSVENVDDRFEVAPIGDFWVGYHIGSQGRYGAVTVQGEISTYYQTKDGTNVPVSLSYFHPTGFHGGLTWVRDTDFTFSLGKTFSF